MLRRALDGEFAVLPYAADGHPPTVPDSAHPAQPTLTGCPATGPPSWWARRVDRHPQARDAPGDRAGRERRCHPRTARRPGRLAAGDAAAPHRRGPGAAAVRRRRHRARVRRPDGRLHRRAPSRQPSTSLPGRPGATPRSCPTQLSACSTTTGRHRGPGRVRRRPRRWGRQPTRPAGPGPRRRGPRRHDLRHERDLRRLRLRRGARSSGTQVRIDDDGRIHLGGATLATGYLGRPDLTATAFYHRRRRRGGSAPTTSGTSTSEGRWHVDGRLDDLITTGGLKVAPRLVEEALDLTARHRRGRRRRHSRRRSGARPSAPPSSSGRPAPRHAAPTVGELRELLRGILPSHALPRRLLVLDRNPAARAGQAGPGGGRCTLRRRTRDTMGT